MIKLTEFLNIDKNSFNNFKIHFATGADDKLQPYNKFLLGEFKDWQYGQTPKMESIILIAKNLSLSIDYLINNK